MNGDASTGAGVSAESSSHTGQSSWFASPPMGVVEPWRCESAPQVECVWHAPPPCAVIKCATRATPPLESSVAMMERMRATRLKGSRG